MWNKNAKSHGFVLGFVSALVLALLVGSTWLMVNIIRDSNKEANPERPMEFAHQELEQVLSQESVNLTLKQTYVCGTELEEKLTKTVPSLEQVFLDYQDWELVSQQGNHFVFKKLVHDLAPICRENGYFGLSDQGILTLFEGLPAENKVIQTFFQIDTVKLESSLQNDLRLLEKGIRIHDLAEYNSILSTYGEYADGKSTTHLTEHLGEQ